MRIGRDLESYVAERFCEATGKKVRQKNAMFLHDDYDYISANIDREVVGENAGLECKTTNLFAKSDFESGEVPLYYYCQCMHYMAVMGFEKMYLAILVLGKAFYWFEIQRDENEIESLIKAECDWWDRYIIGDEIPEIDCSESTYNTVKALYPTAEEEKSIVLFGNEETVRMYKLAKQKEKEYKELAAQYQNQIAAHMGDAETAILDGYTITYKNQARTMFNSKNLRAEFPDIWNKYSHTTISRVMKIKEA